MSMVGKFQGFIAALIQKYPLLEEPVMGLVLALLVVFLVIISIPGHVISTLPQSFPGDVVIDLSILPLALAVVMCIGFAWSIARIGFTEAGGTEFKLLLWIQWLLIIIGMAFSRWHNGRPLFAAAAEALTITALLNISMPLLFAVLFTLKFIGVVIFAGKARFGDLLRIWICVLLICVFALAGYWLLNLSGWLQPAM